MNKIFIYIVFILFCFSCNQPSKKPLEVIPRVNKGMAIIPMLNDDSTTVLHSIVELKNLMLGELQEHQSDHVYKRAVIWMDTVSHTNYQTEIIVGYLFHPNIKSAVLGWSVSDTTMDVEVFNLHEDNTRTSIFTINDQPSLTWSPRPDEFLQVKDYDGDGWPDLEVMIDSWDGIDIGSRSRLWLVKQGAFRPVRHFEEVISPELDSMMHQICSYESGGCMDMVMHFSVWQLEADSVKMTQEMNVDCCSREDGNCSVTIDGQQSILVPGNKVHLYVPRFYRSWIKEKMSY